MTSVVADERLQRCVEQVALTHNLSLRETQVASLAAAGVPRKQWPERMGITSRTVLVRTYRIVYRVDGDGIVVITVFEGHRLFPDDALGDE